MVRSTLDIIDQPSAVTAVEKQVEDHQIGLGDLAMLGMGVDIGDNAELLELLHQAEVEPEDIQSHEYQPGDRSHLRIIN